MYRKRRRHLTHYFPLPYDFILTRFTYLNIRSFLFYVVWTWASNNVGNFFLKYKAFSAFFVIRGTHTLSKLNTYHSHLSPQILLRMLILSEHTIDEVSQLKTIYRILLQRSTPTFSSLSVHYSAGCLLSLIRLHPLWWISQRCGAFASLIINLTSLWCKTVIKFPLYVRQRI